MNAIDPRREQIIENVARVLRVICEHRSNKWPLDELDNFCIDQAADAEGFILLCDAMMKQAPLSSSGAAMYSEAAAHRDRMLALLGITNPYRPRKFN